MEKGEAIGVDVLEVAAVVGVVGTLGYKGYKYFRRAMTRVGGEEVQQVETLANNAARDTGPNEIIDARAQAMRDFKEVGDTMTSIEKGEPVKFGGKASEVTENSIENYATGALSSHMTKHPDHIKRMIDEKLSPSTWEEVSRNDEPRLRKVRSDCTRELKGHYKSQIEDFIRDNPDATEMDLKLDTKALIDPDKPINPDDLDEDNLVSRVMNDDSRLIDTNINVRRVRREATRAVNNNDLRIEPPDHKKGGQNDGGRLDNDGEIGRALEAPQKIAESIEEGVGGEIEEVVPQVEDKVVDEVAGTVEADVDSSIEAAEEAAEGAEQEFI